MENGKMEREGKNKSQHLGFLSHNILGHSQGVLVGNPIGKKNTYFHF